MIQLFLSNNYLGGIFPLQLISEIDLVTTEQIAGIHFVSDIRQLFSHSV